MTCRSGTLAKVYESVRGSLGKDKYELGSLVSRTSKQQLVSRRDHLNHHRKNTRKMDMHYPPVAKDLKSIVIS